MNAMSAKANHLIICFYLDKQTEPFAQLGLKRQKRDEKWSETNQSVSIYDKKISGKHQISFKISSSDENDTENSVSVVLRSVTFAKSTVPVMYFDIDEQQGSIDGMNYSPEHDSECYGKVKIEIPDGYQCEYANDKGQTDNLKTATYDLEYIRGRGNSTWGTDKKPYKLKLQKKADLFNMGKNKHWVLLADYYDPTHMRNKMTYWLGQELGMEYTPQCVYVDVVMNGEYYGSYLLCEQVRIDKSRVDIDNLEDTPDATEEPTVTGGYLLSMCPQTLQEGKTFSTDRENEFQIESPEFEEEINEAQCDYIHNYVNDTEKAIYSPDFTDENGKSYKEYLDVASAIKYYWIQEFSGNGDGFISTSSYLYKKRDIENEKGKLFFGPLWDFDYVAWGNNDFDFYQCSDWVHRNSFWFDQLFKDDSFAEEVIQEWPELKNALNKICEDGGLLDQYKTQIAYSMNYNKDLYGTNYDYELGSYTFDENVEQLKSWIIQRTEWIDNNIDQLKPTQYTVTFKDGSNVIARQIVYGGDMISLPDAGEKDGYEFDGWYYKDDEENETLLEKDTPIYNNITAFARWIDAKDIKPLEKIILGYNNLSLVYCEDDEDNYFSMPYSIIGGRANQLIWTSSNEEVIRSLGNGNFELTGFGDATIIASSKDGKIKTTASIRVGDTYDGDFISGISLNKKEISLEKGEYTVLEASLLPNDTSPADITWICTGDSVSIEPVGHSCIVREEKDGTSSVIALIYGEDGLMTSSCTIKTGANTKPVDPGNTAAKDVRPGDRIVKTSLSYQIISITKSGGTVKVIGAQNKKDTRLRIPSTIRYRNKKYTVVGISKNAFKNNRKLKQITIGKNIKTIGENAFSGCNNLKKIIFNGTSVRKIGRHAFRKTSKKITVTAKKKCRKKYQTLMKKSGAGKIIIKK